MCLRLIFFFLFSSFQDLGAGAINSLREGEEGEGRVKSRAFRGLRVCIVCKYCTYMYIHRKEGERLIRLNN